MAITALYASVLALIFVWLSIRVIRIRQTERIEIGTGDNKDLFRLSRVHSNFAEYTPIALVLMALAESLKAPFIAVHIFGLLLLAGRTLHAFGLGKKVLKIRVAGMVLTFAAIVSAALTCFALSAFYMAV